MSEPIDLLPITACAPVGETCAPRSCDLPSIYKSLQAICPRLYAMEAQIEQLLQERAQGDTVARLTRLSALLDRRMVRMEESAIVCIGWNEDTCAIQGTTINNTTKVFDADPCTLDLKTRVGLLEGESTALGTLTSLVNQMDELTTEIGGLLKTVTIGDGCSLTFETQAGAVTNLDIHECAPASVVMVQEVQTVIALATQHDVAFNVPHDSIVELNALFLNPVDDEIYNFDILDDTPASINTFTGAGVGALFSDTTPNKHLSRNAQMTMFAGDYTLRITKAGGGSIAALEISLQLKAIV